MTQLPPPDSFACYAERIRCLQALHSAAGTSWGRTENRNTRVGGHKWSKHLLIFGMMGTDLVPDVFTPARLIAMKQDAETLGLWAKIEDDHLHVQGLPPGEGRMP